MARPARGEATYQDVLDAPEHQAAELIDGELHLWPRPAGPHASVTGALFADVHGGFRRGGTPGGWIILIEPELHLGRDVMVPDLAGWRLERMPHVEDVPFFTLAPDWLCETLSRSTEAHDRSRKLRKYAAAGVGHVWLLHPIRRTLEVLRLHEGKWLVLDVHQGDARVRAEPFDAIELDLARLWADLAPPPAGRAGEELAEYEASSSP